MKLAITTKQRKEQPTRPKMAYRTSCPKCQSKNLIRSGPDQFCCDCDWDTCREYVNCGLMNNLFVAALEHFGDSLTFTEKSKSHKKSEIPK